MKHYFEYGEEEVAYLKRRDKRLAELIDTVEPIKREVTPDLFSALVHSIVGQQISSKAHATVWGRMKDALGAITPNTIMLASQAQLQSFGMTFKKAAYVHGVAERVIDGRLDLRAMQGMSDEELCRELVAIPGVGVWTAEMLMIFSMQRKDVISFGDLAIQRGLRMVYHHRVITKELFAKYKRRYSPYASIASLYLWAVAGGALECGGTPATGAPASGAQRELPGEKVRDGK